MLAFVVEHQAGIPLLMQPLSGHRSDGEEFGQVVSDPMAQLHPTASPTYLVADSALYSAEHLHKLSETSLKRITRVPAALTKAQEVLAQAQLATMPLLQNGYRARSMLAMYGSVAQRWVLSMMRDAWAVMRSKGQYITGVAACQTSRAAVDFDALLLYDGTSESNPFPPCAREYSDMGRGGTAHGRELASARYLGCFEHFCRQPWSDGLPVVPPTKALYVRCSTP